MADIGPSDRRRRMVLRLLAAGLIGADAVAHAPRTWAQEASDGVNRLIGSVSVNGQAADVGTPVGPGDSVTTGPDGHAVVVIGDNAFLFRNDSEVEFEPEPDNIAVRALTIVSGAVLSVFGPGDNTIRTPVASIGIRGTAAYVNTGAAQTYVCVCYGEAEFRSAQGQVLDSVRTFHHNAPKRIHGEAAGARIEPAPVVDHTDAELILLESLVGRVPRSPARDTAADGCTVTATPPRAAWTSEVSVLIKGLFRPTSGCRG